MGEEPLYQSPSCRFRARKGQPEKVQGLLSERPGQNLALAVFYVPSFLERGWWSLVSQKVFIRSISKSPFPHKSVDFFFT